MPGEQRKRRSKYQFIRDQQYSIQQSARHLIGVIRIQQYRDHRYRV